MKIKSKLRILLLTILCASPLARGQGTAFTYQGRLNDNGAAANGSYDLRFTIYDSLNVGIQQSGPLTNSAVAVSNGLFTVILDFGAGVFTGPSRWLDIAVRTNGNGSFTALNPRQPLSPSPYAIYATTASNVVSGSAVTSLNGLKDNVTLAAGANVTVTPNGNTLTIASTGAGGSDIWNLNGADAYYTAGNVGIGTNSPTPGYRLDVNGNARFRPSGGIPGGSVQFGTPSGETGMSIVGVNRADVRFDNSTLKLLAGFGTGAMPSENGIAINTSGNVGIGNTFPTERLTVGGASLADTKLEINAGGNTYAALRVVNSAGAWLWQVTPANDLPGGRMRLTDATSGTEPLSITHSGNVGIGTANPQERLTIAGVTSYNTGLKLTGNAVGGTGIALENTSAGGHKYDLLSGGSSDGIGAGAFGLFDETTGTYRLSTSPTGNLKQPRNENGLVKAMAYVNANGTIARSYNGVNSSTFTITEPIVANHSVYRIDFGFQVNDRFVSVTPVGVGANLGATCGLADAGQTANQVDINIFHTDVDYIDSGTEADFMIIVY